MIYYVCYVKVKSRVYDDLHVSKKSILWKSKLLGNSKPFVVCVSSKLRLCYSRKVTLPQTQVYKYNTLKNVI